MGTVVLAATLALPTTTATAASTTVEATATLQTGSLNIYGTPTAVTPDVAYSPQSGMRVEVYTSAGDNDGAKADWRSVNEYAYLINSVPKGKQLYSTVFNALYDYGKAKKVSNQWTILNSSGKAMDTTSLFQPTVAFLNQINQYLADGENPTDYVHVLGAKESMTESYKAPSSLSTLLKDSGVMKYCNSTKTGACLTTTSTDSDSLMHSKYSLFEQAKDSTGKVWNNVIWVTSANLNGASGGKKSNTSVVIYGDSAGYQGLLNNVWTPAITQTLTSGYKTAMTNGVSSSDSDFSFYPSPRITSESQAKNADFEAKTLAAAAAVSGKTNCKAYLAHSLFNASRQAILDNLATLQTQGCSVKIMLGDNAIADTVDAYFGMSNDARKVINRVEFGNVHDKAITVSYTAGGTTYGTTWGGSANANGTSLTHDELAFKAESLTVTRAVEQQLERVYQLIRGGITNVQVTGLSLSPATVSLNTGSSRTLVPKFSPSNATVRTVTYTSSNTSVATVNATSGKVTAVGVGTATITATSLSGNRTATSAVTVKSDSDETPQPSSSALVVYTPPTLTMDNYQQTVTSGDNSSTQVVVSWGEGSTDFSGTVALQYYDAGKWKTKTTISVKNGRGTKTIKMKSSRAYRLKATSVTGGTIGSSGKYSVGYSYSVVKTKANTTTPRIYAPTMVKSGDLAPFFVTVKNPKGNLRLQYLAGSGWKTKVTFSISGGGTQKFISAPVGSTRKWRVVTSNKKSSSVTVKVTG
ncbi:Ig-like domain-containing protein [Propionicimonas sp.]|uniref:Ig-like domain-containing protein n=1 Tax=Propionicimonas sp. TaxID=1955623 RepID=UPI0039E582B2